MFVTLSGISIEVKALQSSNALSPMYVTLSGISIEAKLLQSENAYPPMLVTLSGSSIEVKALQFSNADHPMHVTVDGMIVLLQPNNNVFVEVSIKALQLFLLSKWLFVLSTTIEVKPLQPEKALSPILFTLFGISIEVKPLQPEYSQIGIYQQLTL